MFYGQFLRLVGICTYEKVFNKDLLDMKLCFLEREHSQVIIYSPMEKVTFGEKSKGGSRKSSIGDPFSNNISP